MRNTHFISKKRDAQGALRHAHFVETIATMGIGEKIKAIRTARGLKLTEVEALAGMSYGNLSRVERGKQWLTEEKIYAIADVLGVSPAAFFVDESVVVDHIKPRDRLEPDPDNLVLVDSQANQWLSLRENLGSEDVAEFTSLIKARQERNIKLIEELENSLHRRRPTKSAPSIDVPIAEEQGGKKQSSQSS